MTKLNDSDFHIPYNPALDVGCMISRRASQTQPLGRHAPRTGLNFLFNADGAFWLE
jgi:hypothetical protein